MNKNNILVSILAIIIIAAGVFFILNGQDEPVIEGVQTQATGDVEETGQLKELEDLPLISDKHDFSLKFLLCEPSQFKTPFNGGTYTINVFGLDNGKCSYNSSVTDSSGAVLQKGYNCLLPKGLLSQDVFNHFFGEDKIAGSEKTFEMQVKLETDFCKK